jgi:hypothetical protein
MKIKTTKTLCKFLSEKLKEHETTKNYTLTHEQLTQNNFSWLVDMDYYKHTTDYNYNNNKFNVFKITYPQNYFANDLYLTTKDLTKIFDKCDHTANGFVESFINYIEI